MKSSARYLSELACAYSCVIGFHSFLKHLRGSSRIRYFEEFDVLIYFSLSLNHVLHMCHFG